MSQRNMQRRERLRSEAEHQMLEPIYREQLAAGIPELEPSPLERMSARRRGITIKQLREELATRAARRRSMP